MNTASWKYIIPQLYKKYPNEDMVLNFAVSAPPKVVLSRDGISSVTSADMTIKVKDATTLEQTPVACISLVRGFDLFVKNVLGSSVTRNGVVCFR